MAAPDPNVITRLVEDTRTRLLQANLDYGYLWSSAYQRGTGGGAGRVATSSTPDLADLMTGDVATMRRYVDESARQLFDAYRRIQIAQARLNDVADMIDRGKPADVEQHERALPHPADRGDVRRAEKARDRRVARMVRGALPWSRDEVMG